MERGSLFVEGANAYSSEGRLYFIEHERVAKTIKRLMDDDRDLTCLSLLSHRVVRNFKDSTWELIGDCIARNNHVKSIELSNLQFDDEKMSLLFKHLTRTSVDHITISQNNSFGPIGVRCMLPSLSNAPSLTSINLSGDENHPNHNFTTECFNLVVESLHEGAIKELTFRNCIIDDITVLERYTLPHLQELLLGKNRIQNIPSFEHFTNLKWLQLSHNRVGDSGCRQFAQLLQNNSSVLEGLHLDSNNITCEGVELLTSSILSESRLESLNLDGNDNLIEGGCRVLLKLLCDVTSLKSTHNSNHRLISLSLPRHYMGRALINRATRINRGCRGTDRGGTGRSAGRRKIIEIQLNSSWRKIFCELQGIEYSYNSLFEGIDPLILPDILALVQHRTELFSMLLATAPLLASLVNRKAAIQEKIEDCTAAIATIDAEYKRQIAALNAKRLQETSALNGKIVRLKEELDTLGSEDNGIRSTKECGSKRKQMDAL